MRNMFGFMVLMAAFTGGMVWTILSSPLNKNSRQLLSDLCR
jgi:hypothetical protein